jgi:hypothetical protein
VQPSPLLAPFYREAISQDSSLVLGKHRQKLAIKAKELRALEKERKKFGDSGTAHVLDQDWAFNIEGTGRSGTATSQASKKYRVNGKWLLGVISIAVAILVIILVTPSQTVSSPKNDKALIENLFNGLNKATSAQDQFSYILTNNYPGFLNASTAKFCASGRKPATRNSYTPLVSPVSVEFNTIKSISSKFSTNYSFDGSYGPDNLGFKGRKIEGRTYSVKVSDKLSSGGQVYTFDKDVKVTVKDGKAYWYSHYC